MQLTALLYARAALAHTRHVLDVQTLRLVSRAEPQLIEWWREHGSGAYEPARALAQLGKSSSAGVPLVWAAVRKARLLRRVARIVVPVQALDLLVLVASGFAVPPHRAYVGLLLGQAAHWLAFVAMFSVLCSLEDIPVVRLPPLPAVNTRRSIPLPPPGGYECVLTPHKKRGRPRKNTSEPADKVADLDVRQLWAELTGMQEFPAELTALTNDIDPGMSFMSPEFNLIPGDPLFAPSNYAFPFDSLPASATQPTFGFAADTPSAVSQDEAKHSDVRMSPGSSTQVSVGMAVDDGVRKYFQFVHPWIPLLHRPTFERQINDGSVDPLLYYAVQAIAARFADSNSGKKPWKRGARYARAARRLLPEALKRAQLSTLQAISILALYMSVSGQWQAGAALEKLAVQLAFAGQYHLLDEEFLLPPVTNNMGLFEAGWSEHSQPARLEVLSRPGGVLEHEQRRRAW
ncbi:hypothetical protein H4S02_008740, partial [Coemansia sp. RSA 2611]